MTSSPKIFSESTSLSLVEVLLLVCFSYAVFLIALFLLGGSYWSLVGGDFGDNGPYLDIAHAIETWQFTDVSVKQFWGVSYAVAAVTLVTGLSDIHALVLVCITASLASVTLCYRLWGGWVAVFFALPSFAWLQRSLLGGAEPLFVALLLGTFLALRKSHWQFAAVLAALATVVRPFGIFALVGLALALLYRKRWAELAITTAIALAIGSLYAWPLLHYFGSPFANIASYQQEDWQGGFPFNLPFVAILNDTDPATNPWTNLALTWSWILLVLTALVTALHTGKFADYAKHHSAEACFAGLYCLALFTYNAAEWSRAEFPRFALPVLPWMLLFVLRYLPKSRPVLWLLAVASPCLAAASTVGIRAVLGMAPNGL